MADAPTPTEVIAQQAVVIARFVQLTNCHQTLVAAIVNALRLYMLDVQALGAAVQAAEPLVPEPEAGPETPPRAVN